MMEKVKELTSRGTTAIAIFALMFTTAIQVSFAEEPKYSITKKFITLFNDIRGDLVMFSTAAAGVCAVVCLLLLLFTKNERVTQSSWDWLKRIGICYVCILSITTIISFFGDFAV